jgi:hypothetical protein
MQKHLMSLHGRRARRAVLHWTTLVAVMAVVHHVRGATIVDVSYFTSKAHTLVTFEQRGNGSPTPTDNATLLPASEYSAWGFTFAPGLSPGVAWINDPEPSTDAAQVIGGSLQLAIGATDNRGDFYIHFTQPVRAFGFWVQHSTQRAFTPAFDALDDQGLIESAFFSGSVIDGSIGNIAYGFLGIAPARPIHSIHLRGDIVLLDNFRFIAVPEPTGSGWSWCSGLALAQLALRRNRARGVTVANSAARS